MAYSSNETLSNSENASWVIARHEGRIGTGDWRYFPKEFLGRVNESAAEWRGRLKGVAKPWLCWCIDEEWCLLQQRLVAAVGWTPVVGTDGRFPKPRLIDEAIFVNFNEHLELPTMWMHFPLEFVFLFSARLAYWHSDVLAPVEVMQQMAAEFEDIHDGELRGVKSKFPGFRHLFKRLKRGTPLFYKRWWEVVGCTTKGASRSQFDNGCGWWRNPHLHKNAQPVVVQSEPWREHGVGIWYWEKYFNGRALPLSIDIRPYHYTVHKPAYIRRRGADGKLVGSKRDELLESFDLQKIESMLNLDGR